jgi:regulatory protein
MHDDEPGSGHEAGGDTTGKRKRGRGNSRQEQSPTQRALGFLVRREHSRKELTRKLTSRGLDVTEVAATVERLAGEGWQDDARFAGSLIRSRAGNGYGPIRIRAELATHGLDREAIAQAMDSYEGDWAQIARELVRRRFGESIEDLAVRRKAADLLLRRGFDSESVRAATRTDPDD